MELARRRDDEDEQLAQDGTANMAIKGLPADVKAAVKSAVVLYNCTVPRDQQIGQTAIVAYIIRRWMEEGSPLPKPGTI